MSHSKKESQNQESGAFWNEEWGSNERDGLVVNEWCKKSGRSEKEEWREEWSTRVIAQDLKHSKCKKWARGDYGERETEWSDYVHKDKREHWFKLV